MKPSGALAPGVRTLSRPGDWYWRWRRTASTHRVAEDGRDVERLAILRQGQSRRGAPVLVGRLVVAGVARGQGRLAVRIPEGYPVRQQAVGVVESIDQVVEPAADEQPLAVR